MAALKQLGFWELDLSTRQLRFSSNAARLIDIAPGAGISLEEFLDAFVPADRERLRHILEQASAGFSAEIARCSVLSSKRLVEITAELVESSGETSRLSGVLIEVERSAPRESLEFQAKLLSAVGQAIVATTLDGTIQYWGGGAERVFGWTAEEALGHNVVDITPSDISRAQAEEIMTALSRGGSWSGEFQAKRKDGENIWLFVTDTPVIDADGKLAGIVGVSHDITLQKRSEQALLEAEAARRQSELRFHGLLSTVDDVFWISRPAEKRLIYVSPSFEKIWGQPASRMHSEFETWLATIHPEDRPRVHQQFYDTALAGGYDAEYRVVRADGTIRWIRDRGFPIRSDRGELTGDVAGLAEDITDRKQTAEQLRASEERFRTLTHAIPQLVWSCLPDGRCDYLSPQWIEYTGVPEEQQLGFGWLEQLHPEDRATAAENWMEAVRNAGPYSTEFRIRAADGQYRWFKTLARPLRDPDGHVSRWIGTNTDIEEQKRTEAALRRANEDLDLFAYTASHDLQEPLRGMSVYSQLLLRRYRDQLPDEARQMLDVIDRSGRRMADMVRGILMYSRFKEEHEWPRAEDARNALEHAIADLEPKIRETGAVVLYDGLPKVRVEPSQLRQVFQNLISNGLKYQQRGCVPRIEVTAEPGVHVHRFTVTDNGIGIHSADFERIFGLFKRLHTMEYSGNGLGLAICRRIIGRYGGRIWVESEVGAGSRFHFTLPAAH